MQVKILTYHFVENYGAALQAYGLQKGLRQLGHDVSFIDYRPRHLIDGGSFWWPVSRWRCRANLVIAYKTAMHLRERLQGNGGKTERFDAFHRDKLKIEGPVYRSHRELCRRPPEADALVCGSDQIWNSSEQFGVDPAYFLGFSRPGQKTLSYAGSFGRPFVEKRFESQVQELLGGVQSISIREESGVKIVKDLTGRDATWVPDPTFLVDDGYPDAIEPTNQEPYLFSYTLRSRELVQSIEQFASRHLKVPVISPPILKSQGKPVPGPLEWLGYIKASRFVVTNSFHGVAFSVILRKPFVFAGLSGPKAAFNERALSLLTRLGLQDRMMFEFDAARMEQLLQTQPDWASVESTLGSWREEAFSFLKSSLAAR